MADEEECRGDWEALGFPSHWLPVVLHPPLPLGPPLLPLPLPCASSWSGSSRVTTSRSVAGCSHSDFLLRTWSASQQWISTDLATWRSTGFWKIRTTSKLKTPGFPSHSGCSSRRCLENAFDWRVDTAGCTSCSQSLRCRQQFLCPAPGRVGSLPCREMVQQASPLAGEAGWAVILPAGLTGCQVYS